MSRSRITFQFVRYEPKGHSPFLESLFNRSHETVTGPGPKMWKADAMKIIFIQRNSFKITVLYKF